MANIKIQQLAAKTAPGDTDVLVIEDTSSTKKITWANLRSALYSVIFQTKTVSSRFTSTDSRVSNISAYAKGQTVTLRFAFTPDGRGYQNNVITSTLRPIISSCGWGYPDSSLDMEKPVCAYIYEPTAGDGGRVTVISTAATSKWYITITFLTSDTL